MRRLGILAAGVFLLAGCGGTPASPPPAADAALQAELIRPGTLTVCLSMLGAPAAALGDDGTPERYNADFAREIAARTGLELQFEETSFADLIDAVRTHGCDVSVSSQNITVGRLEQIDMVPYTRASQRVLVRKGNPSGIFGLEEMCGLTVSAEVGSTHADLVAGEGDFDGRGLSALCERVGRSPIELVTFEGQEEAMHALRQGDVDAHLGNQNYAFVYPDEVEQSLASLPAARQGIGVARDRPATREAVEAALEGMIADGTYRQVLLDHLGNEEAVDAGSIEEAVDAGGGES